MKYVLTFFCLTVLVASLALPETTSTATKKITSAPTKKAAAPAKKAAASTTKKTAPTASKTGTRTTATAVRTGSAAKKNKSGRRTVAAAPVRQMTPTPERYKEIQQALVDKGYLKSEPTGVWDTDSTDALKQFQTDKNLTPTGKITAPSLIGLGLGPKPVETGSDPPPTPVPPAAAPPAPAN